MEKRLFTSESVTEGHPDKMCDAISDAILDALMEQDPMSRVACETCTTTGVVMVMGEITTKAYVDIPKIVRETVREIGYTPKVYLKMYKAKKPYRINILQEEHIIMSQKKIRDILINWELENEKIADVVYGETGEISDSAKYVGEDYVIKFSANLGSIKKTIDISHALESIGLLAAQTIPTKDGKYYVEDTGLYYVLSKRIQGENIKVGSVYLDEYLEKARFIGEIVGQLSLALAKIDVVVDDMNILKNVCEWAIPALNEKVVIDKSFLESYQRRFRELYDELPKQIIHRDPNPSNIITNDDKWGFIDFDLSECSVRIYDPCYAASAIRKL